MQMQATLRQTMYFIIRLAESEIWQHSAGKAVGK
jgi:hypothetical protein